MWALKNIISLNFIHLNLEIFTKGCILQIECGFYRRATLIRGRLLQDGNMILCLTIKGSENISSVETNCFPIAYPLGAHRYGARTIWPVHYTLINSIFPLCITSITSCRLIFYINQPAKGLPGGEDPTIFTYSFSPAPCPFLTILSPQPKLSGAHIMGDTSPKLREKNDTW